MGSIRIQRDVCFQDSIGFGTGSIQVCNVLIIWVPPGLYPL